MATETTTEVVGSCVGPTGSAIGLPQLCFDWFPNQIFWLLVTLVVIYFLLARIALPRISAVLAERQGTITNDIAAADDLKAQAQEAEAAYDKALADARAEAQKIAAETRAEIQAELDRSIAEADADIAAKTAESEAAISEIRKSALESVQIVARDTAREIVRALGAQTDEQAINAAVDDRLKG
ncbi:F-type H+-transporting ATPase subunit b [Poseidonocella pacifica]|uniref:ATP synthase subunit b n=1 Tax=Poseidonocella pacifica TaxID=871651 RepID=A0A1I0Y234_9RHOB|nr:F0F1 ATP synthase subunit B' [Poseidonocella pacifica]SFB07371.1 F-type H+-transporting ATPase subunit b [Poseidonocella pacifica]